MPDLISLKSICIKKQNKHILQDVSMLVNSNDFITIIGPNGAGKSTLLKCLMGLEKPQKGEIIRQDNLNIGYVPQYFTLDQTLPITADAFLRLCSPNYDNQLDLIKSLEVDKFLHTQLYNLSGGQLQRLLLAKALIGKPQLLVLDEPTKGLDIKGEVAFYDLLEKIHKEMGMAIVMVSHDLHMVISVSKKVICLYHHICCSGTPSAITKHPKFIDLFGDSLANRMAIYQHRDHNHSHD